MAKNNIIVIIILMIILSYITLNNYNRRYHSTDVIVSLPGKQMLVFNKNNLPYPPGRVWYSIVTVDCHEYFLHFNAGP